MEIVSQLICVLAVFGLLGFTLWWLKRRGAVRLSAMPSWGFPGRRATTAGKLLERVEGLQLSATHSLSVVRMADRAIVIGISPGGFQVIDNVPWTSLKPEMGATE